VEDVTSTDPEQPTAAATEEPREVSVYEVVGEQFFFDLVGHFYDGVEDDEILGPMYPADDMEGAKQRLALFLLQFWGGPQTYSEQRGHPRLRMRHMPFAVDDAARDAWLGHMEKALDKMDPHPAVREVMMGYFNNSANFLRNQ
jgi:hemoglobin